MSANLTPQYYAAEERYKQASDDRERLKALKEMLAIMPKHKGTEKLQGELKRKIARIRDDLETGNSKKGGKRFSYRIEKDGAGQVSIVGPPNVGKAHLVNSLTNAHFEEGDYPFTTRMFQPAMMPYEDIQIQLIDLPPLSEEHLDHWVPSIIKTSDAVLLTFDVSKDDILDQIESTCSILAHHKIECFHCRPAAEDVRWTYMTSLVLGLRMDKDAAEDNLHIVKEFYPDDFVVYPVHGDEPAVMDQVRSAIVKMLDVVRVYSKRPGHDAEMDNPFVLKRSSTLMDFATEVHKDFAEQLKFARIWGEHTFDGQRITHDYVLADKDIIELHI